MASSHSLVLLFSMLAITLIGCVKSVPVRGGYYPSWRPIPPSKINTTLFTHIFYASVKPSNVTFKFEVSNSTAALLSNFTTTLRKSKPPVQTLLSIGEATDGPLLAKMANSSDSRKAFIDSSLEVARKFGFDGLDLNWLFPQTKADMDNFETLLREWNAAITKESGDSKKARLLLTSTVYFSPDFSPDFSVSGGSHKYPTNAINTYLDWINVLSFGYHGAWDRPSVTGAQSAFFDPKSNLSSYYGLNSWLNAGVPAQKLVMGLPLFGRTWTLKDPNVHGVGAPAVGEGPGKGILMFSEVVQFNKKYKARVVYDVETVSIYACAGTSWVGYDDVISLTTKSAYAQALRLHGYFFYALGFEDDFEIASQVSKGWIMQD